MLLSFIPFLASITLVYATTSVTVQVDKVYVAGNYNATSGVDEFLGLKYGTAQRFRRSTAVSYSSWGAINATAHGPACPQIKGTNSLAVDYGIYGTAEDFMVWIHGGALTQGAAWYYSGAGMVQESSKINLPVITVILNYRLAAWGFLGGKEAAANGALNLGLYDQKLALEWIQKNIKYFGGDKSMVTVFGQSSGAMSIAYHMLNTSTTLFSGAILQSGTTTSVPVLPTEKYQGNYDALVSVVGCSTSPNTFECLRTVNRDVLIDATNVMFGQPDVYASRPWGVAIDGDIIPASPSVLTAKGKIAKIPFITGNVMDEGTIFVKPQTVATDSDLLGFLERDYLNRNATFFKNQTSTARLRVLYPNNPALGSPYNTGNTTFFGTQFKRAAAIYSDIHFNWARRNFLKISVSTGVKSWSFIFNQVTPGNADWQGVFHTGEIPYIFMKFSPADNQLYSLAKQMLAYWVSFAYNRDPAYRGNPTWDLYRSSSKHIEFTAAKTSMQADTFHKDGTDFIGSIANQLLESST